MDGGRIIAEGPPETIAETPISATGQYLKPLLERASTKPVRPEEDRAKSRAVSKGRKPSRSSRAKSRGVNEDEPDLIAAK